VGTESFQSNTPDRTVSADTSCPEWCTLEPDHDLPVMDGDARHHGGPTFGPIHTRVDDSGHAYSFIDPQRGSTWEDDLTAESLRQLADLALGAARWLEER
jgi:hypothetical protein